MKALTFSALMEITDGIFVISNGYFDPLPGRIFISHSDQDRIARIDGVKSYHVGKNTDGPTIRVFTLYLPETDPFLNPELAEAFLEREEAVSKVLWECIEKMRKR